VSSGSSVRCRWSGGDCLAFVVPRERKLESWGSVGFSCRTGLVYCYIVEWFIDSYGFVRYKFHVCDKFVFPWQIGELVV